MTRAEIIEIGAEALQSREDCAMTATTKEQRESLLQAINDPECWMVDMAPGDIRPLLADSERLAAIEAVTGDRADKLADYLSCVANGDPVSITLTQDAATALLSLSAKVAEQAEEIERESQECRRWVEARDEQQLRAEAAEAERDTLRRLLTETAVPVLEKLAHNFGYHVAHAALSTIRAQMEDANG